ncbi:PD-(D/E)XK nuclease family transposase [Fibrobacter sp. UWEL]|uniref:PD-(D/E)XK nuclease family transposase n=1 Tax=Fibrobacter sp. UWEL TaxID=1896209 RepID=UPI000920C12E|nr:PD-(D/E)XK nuclease family transposase [Fibrobacter sp. UWEL]SHK87401.1 conserved hypothetical protein (putative transposase or invertase) [Fibrobacter sp. UWEL]
MEKNKTKLAECVDNATGVDKKEKIIDFSKIYITDRFMFPLVMSHKEIAKPFIEAALGIKIYDLKDPEQEKTEQVGIFSKSVRYDVFTQQINENGEIISSFDIEMQIVDTKELPKRARYYQSVRDTNDLRKGAMYKSLKDQYVLFICPDDIFGAKQAVYSFQNYATENKNIALNDRSFKNFYIFSNYGKLPDAHPLKPYLKYFATNTADSTETEEIDTKVKWYQADEDTQERYMTWEQEIQLAREDAAEAATEKERERSQRIIAEKDNVLAEKDRRIAELEAKLAEMQK